MQTEVLIYCISQPLLNKYEDHYTLLLYYAEGYLVSAVNLIKFRRVYSSHVKWVTCHHGMARTHVADN
jgi:hypothetical protein